MRLGLAIGAAVVATTMVAYAAEHERNFVFHRGGEHVSADANGDGWLSREEAGADADRLFADLDRDTNGRISDEDHELLRREVEAEVEEAMRNVHIELEGLDEEINASLEGLDEEIEAELEGLDDENCTTTTENEGNTRRVTVVCENEDDSDASDRDRRINRHVRVIRNGDHMVVVPPIPPMPPVPPVPPIPRVHFMLGGDDSEADLNGDGALSREEFRAQQLRYFDAQDANNDGRVRYERPPEPPTPPTPPEPPRRR